MIVTLRKVEESARVCRTAFDEPTARLACTMVANTVMRKEYPKPMQSKSFDPGHQGVSVQRGAGS